jgi:hypothetical protein
VPHDPLLRRLTITAAILCAVMAAAAHPLAGLPGTAAVLGGGLLIGISFHALGGATSALALLMAGETQHSAARSLARRAVMKLLFRYALLGFLAYVMIARLRLPPVGLMAGASSVAAAAFVEAARFLLNGSTRST